MRDLRDRPKADAPSGIRVLETDTTERWRWFSATTGSSRSQVSVHVFSDIRDGAPRALLMHGLLRAGATLDGRPIRTSQTRRNPMRILIVSCCLLLLPALSLAQFPGFGQPDARTPTFNGSLVEAKRTASPVPRLQTGPGIATPQGGQRGPALGVPPRVTRPRPQVGTRTGTNRGGNRCPRQSSFAGPLVR